MKREEGREGDREERKEKDVIGKEGHGKGRIKDRKGGRGKEIM